MAKDTEKKAPLRADTFKARLREFLEGRKKLQSITLGGEIGKFIHSERNKPHIVVIKNPGDKIPRVGTDYFIWKPGSTAKELYVDFRTITTFWAQKPAPKPKKSVAPKPEGPLPVPRAGIEDLDLLQQP